MGKYAGSMRTRALSGAETIHVNGEVLEYLIQGNQHGYCVVHTPQCRTYGTMPYAVCRMKYAVREHASSLLYPSKRGPDLNVFCYAICDLLGITGKRGRLRLEVCPRFPYVHTHVLVFRYLQTHPHSPLSIWRLLTLFVKLYECVYCHRQYEEF